MIPSHFNSPLLFKNLTLEKFELRNNTLRIFFSLGSEHFFIDEVFSIDLPEGNKDICLKKLFEYLAITKAFKYTQPFLSKQFLIKNSVLSEEEQRFWQKYMDLYSMELFYTQNLPVEYLTKLVFQNKQGLSTETEKSTEKEWEETVLLGVGGGKDAICAFELLYRSGISTNFFYTYQHDDDLSLRKNLTEYMASKQKSSIYTLHRKEYDTELITEVINKQKQMGVKPSSPAASVNAIRMIIIAYIERYSYVSTANEKSADTGITTYNGYTVNHQYSKSIEFENELNELIHQYISPNIHYFSVLKPLYELRIAREVAKLPEYFQRFTSCNRSTTWCLSCSKCAFVYTLFAAYLQPQELSQIFSENLFDKAILQKDFLELMGLTGVRPFECVGDEEEMSLAMYYAHRNGYTGKAMTVFIEQKLPSLDSRELERKFLEVYIQNGQHCIPKELLEKIKWESD